MTYRYSDGSTPVGLDVGTSRIVAAWPDETDYVYRSELNSFVALPGSKFTESVLRKENVPHTVRANEILVQGNESERFADLLGAESRRPMARGFLNPDEPESLTMIGELLRSLLGTASHARQKLFFSIPAAPAGAADTLTFHEATLRQMLSELGYDAKSVSEGLAVVYSELEGSNYTGIGISIGGGLCNVCMSYLAVPVISFSVPKAGDYIDASAAAVTNDMATRVRLIKESSFLFGGVQPEKTHQVIAVYYDDLIQSLVGAMKDVFTKSKSLPRLGRPIPLVISGGSTMPLGFRERFERAMQVAEFPVPISEIRLAGNPLTATAKGALIAALSEM
ncbi:MAG: hypothetical protein HYX27_00415 [Acidobacteria bacterium]|nr:hypothetical protein [Acidobacteriota bacterium]